MPLGNEGSGTVVATGGGSIAAGAGGTAHPCFFCWSTVHGKTGTCWYQCIYREYIAFLFKVHVWIRSSNVPTMICLILLLLAIHVATFRPLYVVSGWLGRHVAFFGKAYAQYAIADAVAWLAVRANSTPSSLYNRLALPYCWLFRNCVWSHYKFLMCFLHASENWVTLH